LLGAAPLPPLFSNATAVKVVDLVVPPSNQSVVLILLLKIFGG
jgi:hypothetical protein